jgi:putative heme-binding domain-containing protein
MIDEVTDLAADPHLTQELAHRICALPTHAVHLILKLLAERQIRQIPPGLIRVAFADLGTPSAIDAYVQHLKKQWAQPALIRAAAEGAKRAGTSLQVLDKAGHLASAFSAAALTAQNQQATESSRIEAIDLLRLATKSQAEDALIACLKTEPSVKIQTAAVKALAEVASFSYVASIQLIWPSLKAEAREAALVAILSRDAGALALLREIQNQGAAKVWSPTDLSASQIQAMVNHKNNEVATLAKTVLKSVIPPSREEVTKTYAPAIGMKGDAQAGQNHYISRCMACHEANGMGIEVGPKLTTVKNKGREALLEAILQPHKEVASQYIAYTVNTKDGQTVQGIITADDASSMTIKMMGGAQVTLPRASIQSSSSGGQSLMPEGLEGGLSVQDMADLLSFIETVN